MAAAAIGFGSVSNSEKGRRRRAALQPGNRLDAVVQFAPPDAVERVVDKFMTELDAQLAARRVTIELDAAARRWPRSAGVRRSSARGHGHVKAVADEMLFGRLKDGGRVEMLVTTGSRFTYAPLDRRRTRPCPAGVSDPFDSWYGLAGGACAPAARRRVAELLVVLVPALAPRRARRHRGRGPCRTTPTSPASGSAHPISTCCTRTRPPPRPVATAIPSAGDHPARVVDSHRFGAGGRAALQRGLQPRPPHRVRARPSRPVARRRLRAGQAQGSCVPYMSALRARYGERRADGAAVNAGGTVLRSQAPSACSLLAAQLSSMMRAGGGRSERGDAVAWRESRPSPRRSSSPAEGRRDEPPGPAAAELAEHPEPVAE